MRVLITGSNGFLGKNLQADLVERQDFDVRCFTRGHEIAQLPDLLKDVKFIVHFAGVNRPLDSSEFIADNIDLTKALCNAVCDYATVTGEKVPILFASSSQAQNESQYGQSKLAAENILQAVNLSHGIPVHIFRLPNVFGKWCKPNYNSVVATFCYNIAHDLPIDVHDPTALLTLVYIDDVISYFVKLVKGVVEPDEYAIDVPQYTLTIGELARQIQAFKSGRDTLMVERVGMGFIRALYATYVSYLPLESFSYSLQSHTDDRGIFAEVLKTPDSGQVSFFTAHPGVIRGGHYHHSKCEKFLVVRGQARFRFYHLLTGQTHELITVGDRLEIVDTIPGWAHDITNIGKEEMLVMLWANEVFDRERSDTVACAV